MTQSRLVKAIHGLREVKPDPEFEIGLAAHLRETYNREELIELYARFINGDGKLDTLMRRAIWRALAKSLGTESASVAARTLNIPKHSRSATVFFSAKAHSFKVALMERVSSATTLGLERKVILMREI